MYYMVVAKITFENREISGVWDVLGSDKSNYQMEFESQRALSRRVLKVMSISEGMHCTKSNSKFVYLTLMINDYEGQIIPGF